MSARSVPYAALGYAITPALSAYVSHSATSVPQTSVDRIGQVLQPRDMRPVVPPVPQRPAPIVPLPLTIATAAPQPETQPHEPEAPPKTTPAPPVPQVASKGAETWECRVLARLNTHRRHPRGAMLRHEQGVACVRFVMDREGKVLSTRLERPGGVPDLDRDALALPRHAPPLPKPPEDRPGDTLELVVPIEFFPSPR